MSAPKPSIRVETHRARRLWWWVSAHVVGLGAGVEGEEGQEQGPGADLGGERA